jgi:hypothetical protein
MGDKHDNLEPGNLDEDLESFDELHEAERKALARCPHCGSPNIRRSHTSGLWDRILRLGGLRAYRCRDCRDRFHGSRRRMEI